jgi:hypothetical protein
MCSACAATLRGGRVRGCHRGAFAGDPLQALAEEAAGDEIEREQREQQPIPHILL